MWATLGADPQESLDADLGDPPVGASKDQHRHQFLEDHPVGYARSVAAKWMIGFALRQ